MGFINAMASGDLPPLDHLIQTSQATVFQLSAVAIGDMLTFILNATWRLCRHLDGDAAGTRDVSPWVYSSTGYVLEGSVDTIPGTVSGRHVPLVAERLALPGVGESGRVDILEHLTDELKALYSSPNPTLLREDGPPTDAFRNIPATCNCDADEYWKVLRRMEEAGMIRWQTSEPKCTNGMFAVTKDAETDRLILDGRRCNMFFHPPQKAELGSPSDFVDVIIGPRDRLFVGKADVSNMFYRFSIPEWLSEYFGLPPVRDTNTGQLKFPCLRVLPMGFSHSVLLAQTAHIRILQHSLEGSGCVNVSGSKPVALGSAFFEYIDDHGIFGVDEERSRTLMEATLKSLNDAGLPPKPSKTVLPGAAPTVDCLGMALHDDGVVMPSQSQLNRIITDTQRILATPTTIQRRFLESTLGRWIWILLLNRPLLSVISSETFHYVAATGPDTIPTCTLSELQALLDALPFLVADLKSQPFDLAYATDASLQGGGVCVRELRFEEWVELAECRERRGWYTRFSDWESTDLDQRPCRQPTSTVLRFSLSEFWRPIIATPWRFDDSINILEAHALQLGLRNLLERRGSGSRPLFLLDSTAVLGAISKGRSASSRLNHQCRRVAALLCGGNLRPAWVWVPSETNPADQPSRNFWPN